jgi:hypothetical protein
LGDPSVEMRTYLPLKVLLFSMTFPPPSANIPR